MARGARNGELQLIRAFVGLGQAAGTASEDVDTTPPTGPPTNASAYTYSGSLIGVQWTNGDSLANTEIGFNSSDADPTSVTDTVGPGDTTYETATEDRCFWSVRHIRNGFVTVWVRAPHGDAEGCPE